MYLAIVVLLMLVLPGASVLIEHYGLASAAPVMILVGKWFVFWGCGVRLLLAGVRQFFQPKFTASAIFEIDSDEVLPLVRELGVANFAAGAVGVLSLVQPGFVFPVAISSGLFYGIAGFRHLMHGKRSRNETIAMASDLGAFAVLAAYVAFIEMA